MEIVSLQRRLDMRKRPNEEPAMHQSWKDLIFLHWKYDSQEIQQRLPPELFVDTFNGQAYLTLVAWTGLSRLAFFI